MKFKNLKWVNAIENTVTKHRAMILANRCGAEKHCVICFFNWINSLLVKVITFFHGEKDISSSLSLQLNIVHNSKVKVLYSVIVKYTPTQPFFFLEAIFKRLRHVSHIKIGYFIKVTKSFMTWTPKLHRATN